MAIFRLKRKYYSEVGDLYSNLITQFNNNIKEFDEVLRIYPQSKLAFDIIINHYTKLLEICKKYNNYSLALRLKPEHPSYKYYIPFVRGCVFTLLYCTKDNKWYSCEADGTKVAVDNPLEYVKNNIKVSYSLCNPHSQEELNNYNKYADEVCKLFNIDFKSLCGEDVERLVKRIQNRDHINSLRQKYKLYSDREIVPPDIAEKGKIDGVIQKDKRGVWRIISYKTNPPEFWDAHYDSKEEAQKALDGYHANTH